MSARIRVRPIVDIRTPEMIGRERALEQERADIALESAWRAAISNNIAAKRQTRPNYAKVPA